MASKVNTKFVLSLFIILALASASIAGLYGLQVRGSAARHAARGEEAYAAGDLRRAYDAYGGAVSKEPGNLQYVGRLEEILRQRRPQTAAEAHELYISLVSILKHNARHHPGDAEHHL